MLMTMRALTEAMRALAYVTAAALDNARIAIPMPRRASEHQAFVELLMPVVKGWSTECASRSPRPACRCTAAWVSSRRPAPRSTIATRASSPIYEGTTGIQANDLIGRKTARDGGETAFAVIAEMRALDAELAKQPGPQFAAIRGGLAAAAGALSTTVEWVVRTYASDSRAAHAASVPYLRLWGLAAGGWQLARAALACARDLAAGEGDADFQRAKIATARFYADYHLPQTVALKHAVVTAGESVLALAAEQF